MTSKPNYQGRSFRVGESPQEHLHILHCKKWHEINLLSGYHLFPLKKILLSAEKKLLFQIAVRSGGGWLTIFDVPNVGTGVIMIHVYG